MLDISQAISQHKTLFLGIFIILGGFFMLVAALMPNKNNPQARARSRLQKITGVDDHAQKSEKKEDTEHLQEIDEDTGSRSSKAKVWQAVVLKSIDRFLQPAGGHKARIPIIIAALISGSAIGTSLHVGLGVMLVIAFVLSLLGAAGGAYLMRNVIANRKRTAFLDNFADAIDLIARGVKAGSPVTDAIRAASQDTKEPVKSELRKISDRLSLGFDFKDALEESAERVAIPDFRFFIVTLVVQRETGGQLSETLSNLSMVLRRRKELRLKIKSLTAEGRLSARMVASLPFAIAIPLFLLDPTYLPTMWYDPTGRILLFLALGQVIIGSIIINRMVKPKF